MSRFQVRWTAVARDDLTRIVDFIAADRPLNAVAVLDRLEALARTLEHFPRRGHRVPELARAGAADWLEVTSPPWRIVYRLSGKQVLVLAVVDGRRRLDELLFERLIAVDDED